jgi:citrate lyase beta subunit
MSLLELLYEAERCRTEASACVPEIAASSDSASLAGAVLGLQDWLAELQLNHKAMREMLERQ